MARAIHFSGTYTAIVTPFSNDGQTLDLQALEELVENQISHGVSGLVPCGTTGESPTLTEEESTALIQTVVQKTRGRVPVIAGTGSFSTKKSIQSSKLALKAGADGVMIVMPYYNKPSQEGLVQHVVTIAKEVQCPIILYNIPGRSVVDLSVDATERICSLAPNVLALKDASGNVIRCQELKRRLGSRLTILSGDDVLTLPMMSVGAAGVISVTSNVRPRAVSNVTDWFLQGKFQEAQKAHLDLLELHQSMFIEPNPAPAKMALHLEGRMNASVRLPLVQASESATARVKSALQQFDRIAS